MMDKYEKFKQFAEKEEIGFEEILKYMADVLVEDFYNIPDESGVILYEYFLKTAYLSIIAIEFLDGVKAFEYYNYLLDLLMKFRKHCENTGKDEKVKYVNEFLESNIHKLALTTLKIIKNN